MGKTNIKTNNFNILKIICNKEDFNNKTNNWITIKTLISNKEINQINKASNDLKIS
jgi:hypothetical protein